MPTGTSAGVLYGPTYFVMFLCKCVIFRRGVLVQSRNDRQSSNKRTVPQNCPVLQWSIPYTILQVQYSTVHYIYIFPIMSRGHDVTRLFIAKPHATHELPNKAAAISGAGTVFTVMGLLLFVRAVSKRQTPPAQVPVVMGAPSIPQLFLQIRAPDLWKLGPKNVLTYLRSENPS